MQDMMPVGIARWARHKRRASMQKELERSRALEEHVEDGSGDGDGGVARRPAHLPLLSAEAEQL